MRRIVLLYIALFSLVTLQAQVYDDCASADAAGPFVLPAAMAGGGYPGVGQVFNWTTSGTTDGTFDPFSMNPDGMTLVDDTYFIFQVTTTGYYSFNIIADPAGTGPTTFPMSIGLALGDCTGFVPSDDVEYNFFSDFSTGEPVILCTGMEMMAGEIYILAIATEDGGGGDVEVTVQHSASIISANDDCAISETTADMMFHDNNCSSDGQVWLDYTVTGGASVEIEIATSGNISSLTDPMIYQIIIDCVNEDDAMFDLSGGPTTVANLTCIPVGTVLKIEVGSEMLGTAPFETGDFQMFITDAASMIVNETCADVTSAVISSCEATNIAATNGTTVGACEEAINHGACGVTDFAPTVWFAFTTDANAQSVDIELIDGTQLGGSFVVIDGTSGACPVDDSADMTGCETMVDDLVVSANTTYYVAVAAADGMSTGDFTLNVTPNYTPANDDCAMATADPLFILSDGVALDATNLCASADPDGFCGEDEHTVYFSYTVVGGAGGENIDVQFTIGAVGTPITGTDATEIALGLYTDCSGTALMETVVDPATDLPAADNSALCTMITGAVPVVINCVAPGTVITIAAGSADGNDGDFNITVTEINAAPANDECPNADSPGLGTLPTCELAAGLAVDNTNACVETFTGNGGCAFDTDATVWYEITLPMGTIGVDFSNISDAGYIGLFEDCTPTQVGDCQSGVTGGTVDLAAALAADATYYIAAAQSGAVGEFTFDALAIVPPANDVCDPNAEAIGVAAGPIDGTNACATVDPNGFCGLSTTDGESHTVYYTYTVDGVVGGPNRDVTITMAAGATDGATAVSLEIYNDCLGDVATYTVESGDLCAAFDNAVVLTCVEPGTMWTIAVGSADMAEGTFSIEITESNIAPNRDNCDSPDLAGPIPGCMTTEFIANNMLACPETFAGGAGCAFNVDATVWYSVTFPAGTEAIEVSGIDEGYIGLFTDCMGAQVGDCVDATGGTIDGVMAGDYLIAYAGPNEVEIFYDILPIVPPANDDCAGLDPMFTLISGTSVNGTTNCAGPDLTSTACGIDDMAHTVFYSYTNANAFNVDLTINIVTGGGVTGTDATGASLFALSMCDGTFFNADSEFCTGLGDNMLPCVPAGETIFFMVASAEGEEGDFTITITEDGTQPPNDNDNCTSPFDLSTPDQLMDCQFVTITGNTTSACPEGFNVADGCDFGTNPTVWYQVTSPAMGDNMTMEITNLTGVDNPFLAVFTDVTDCDAPAGLANDMADCVTPGANIFEYMVTAGTTYYIAVGDGMQGEHMFDIRFKVPPVNDICDPDAIELDDNVPLPGTTICATPDPDGYCDINNTDSHVVYYSFEYMGAKNGDVTITVTPTAMNGATDIALGVFTDCAKSVDYIIENPPVGDPCAGEELVFSCVEPGTILTIAVGSVDMGEGDFTITVDEDDSMTPDNDICATATPILIAEDCVFQTVAVDNENACPEEFTGSACDFDGDNIVWYTVDVPANGVGLEFATLSPDLYVGVFANDCAALALAGMIDGGAPDCITDQTQVLGLAPGTYLIGVGAAGMASSDSYSFDIKTITPPPNDICDPDAEDISAIAAGGVAGTNRCATADPTDICGISTMTGHVVYYTYTVISTINTDLTINVSGSGTAATQVSLGIWLGCDATNPANIYTDINPPVEGDECTTIGEDVRFSCVEPGTELTIAVGSNDTEDGDFTITITEDNTMTPANDACDTPEVVTLDEDCVFQAIAGTTVGSCPEDFMGSSCEFDANGIVWFSVDLAMGGVGFEFDGLDPGLFLGIFNSDDCDNLALQGEIGGVGGPTDCLEDNDLILGLTEGTYLIGVGFDGMPGMFEFDIKSIVPPSNDLPCDAEVVDNTMGDADIVIMANNDCATQQLDDPTCVDADVSMIYYTYTMPADANGITVSIESTGMGSGFMIGAYDFDGDCNNTNPTILTESICDAEGGDELILTCLEEGDEIMILVSTAAEDAGTFTLTIDPAVIDPSCVDNDLCADAAAASDAANVMTVDPNWSTPETDADDFVCLTDCNLGSCPEGWESLPCNYGDLPVVFYSFTTDAAAMDATLSVILTGEGATPINPMFSILEACGEPPTALLDGECIESDAGGTTASASGIELDANTTYIIAVADADINDGDFGGEFMLCIKVTTVCNDDPCDPYPLDGNGTNSYTALDCSTNIGSTEDETYDFGVCDEDVTTSSVYFTYEGGANVKTVIIRVTGDGTGTSIAGAVSMTVFEYDAGDCMEDLSEVMVDHDCDRIDDIGSVVINCPIEGNLYLIQIATRVGEEGSFTLDVTENLQLPECVDNDNCETPTELPIPDDELCIMQTLENCNVDACPEIFDDAGDCLWGSGSVVWFTFTTPADVYGGEFVIEPTGGNPIQDAFFGVFEEEACPILAPVAVDGADCVTDPEGITIDLDGETTYLIAVGSPSGTEEGNFNLNYTIFAAPANDDPCLGSDNGPADITGGGMTGTTCCARGFDPADPTPDDFPNVDPCSNATAESIVWYVFFPTDGDLGYELTVNATTIMDNMTVQVFAGDDDTNDGCTFIFGAADLVTSSCADLNATIRFANCDPDIVYFIKVATTEDDCGEFNIDITPVGPDCTPTASDCADAEALEAPTPVSCDDGEDPQTTSGCVDLACPEEAPLDNCEHGNGPTVWFQINIDDSNSNALVTQVDAPGFDAVWSIYQGTSCDDMVPVGEAVQPGQPGVPCSNSDGATEDAHIVPVVDDPATGTPFTYWVAITAIGEITDPSFTLTYFSSLGCIACSGENALDCDNGNFVAMIDGEEVLEEDYQNFCPGDEVEFCFDFVYDATDTGNDWLHGIIPNFGPGWDIEASDLSSVDIGSGFEWFDADGACAPMLNGYQLPNVCTYMENGVLKSCNIACDPACPCETGAPLPDGSPLPSGWFNNSPGGSTTCGTLGCSPASFFGVPGGVFVTVNFCVPLKVRLFDDEECNEENRSLKIQIQTTSDAISGCWEDSSPCIIDPSFTGPEWKVNCDSPPAPIAEEVFICSGEMAGLEITLPDLQNFPILISLGEPDNGAVDGEGSDPIWGGSNTFTANGFATINDVLVNNSDVIQEVIYTAIVESSDFACPAVEVELSVFVYPELNVEFDPVIVSICPDDCGTLEPTMPIMSGSGDYSYLWTHGPTTASIEECLSIGQVDFTLIVTDNQTGCSGEGTVTLKVEESLEFDLGPDITVCQDGSFDGIEIIPNVITGEDVSYTWFPEQDPNTGFLEGVAAGGNNEVFIIDEEQTLAFTNQGLELCATGVTGDGCTSQACVIVFVQGKPTIDFVEQGLQCNDPDFYFSEISAFFDNGDPVENFIVRSCDGSTVFFVGSDPSGTVIPLDPINLDDYDCIEIVAIDEESGCENSEQIMRTPVSGDPIMIDGAEACKDEMVILSVINDTAYDDYNWVVSGDASMTSVNTGSTFAVTADSTTTFLVLGSDAAGCEDEVSVTIIVNEPPVLTLADQFEYCAGSNATAEVSGGVDYLWTAAIGGATVSTDATFTNGTNGTFYVQVTDANGCISMDTTEFVQRNEITINILGSDICDGNEVELSFANSLINIVWNDGTTDIATDVDSILVTAGGTYMVTAEDANGCPANGSITISESMTPQLDLIDVIEVCKDPTGLDTTYVDFASLVNGVSGTWIALQSDPVSFVPPYDNVSFVGLSVSANPYQFVFTTNDATAPCVNVSDTISVNVFSCPCPALDLGTPSPICNDGGTIDLNSGSVKITGEEVIWSVITGPTGQDLAGLIVNDSIFTAASGTLAGEYTVEFTLANDASPCPSTNTTMITVLEAPIVTVNPGNPRICNQTGGSDSNIMDLNTLITTDTPGTWTDASGGAVADPTMIDGTNTALFPGPFPMTVTYTFTTNLDPSSPCNDVSVEASFIVRDCNCPFLDTRDTTVCNSSTVFDLNELLENPEGLEGTWTSMPDGPVTGSTFDPMLLTSNTQVQVLYTLDDDPQPGSNCILEYPLTVFVENQPMLALDPQSPPCSEDTGNGPTSVDLYDWIDVDGTQGEWAQVSGPMALNIDITNPSEAIVEFNVANPLEVYEFQFTTTSTTLPCMNDSIIVLIEVDNCMCPTINIDGAGPFCNTEDFLDLNTLVVGSDPGSFVVMRGAGTIPTPGGILTLNNADPGTYTVTYILDEVVTGNCIQSVETTIILEEFVGLTLDPPTWDVCNNNNNGNVAVVNFSMFPSSGFNLTPWDDIDGTGVDLTTSLTNVSFENIEAGDYRFSVAIDNADPCPDSRDTITITVDSCLCPLVQPLDPMPVCLTANATSIDLTDYDDVNQPGTWASEGDVFTISGAGELDLTGAVAGNYNLIYTIDNPSPDPQCDPTDTVILVLLVPSEAGTGGSNMTCVDDPQVFDLFDLLDGEDTGGSWDPAPGLDAMAGTFDTDGLAADVYTLTYRFLAAGECPADEATVTITINDLPIVTIGPGGEINCDNPDVFLDAMGSSTGADFTYLWEELDNNVVLLDSTSMSITATQAGRYRLTVTNVVTGCNDFAEVVVTESDDKPSFIPDPTDVECFGDNNGSVEIVGLTGGVEPYTYSFNGGPFVTESELTLNGLDPGNYTLEVVDANGCSSGINAFVITEPGPVSVAIDGAPIITGEIGQSFVLTIEPFDTTGITSVVWSEVGPGGPVVGENVTSINVSPPETTTYYVEVSNANGCTDSDQIQLQLELNIDIEWPNIINPNGGENPTFYIIDNDVELINKLVVFDRWGNKVFTAENILPNDPSVGWDGTYKGKDVVPGVYVFYIEVTYIAGQGTDSFGGDITVNK